MIKNVRRTLFHRCETSLRRRIRDGPAQHAGATAEPSLWRWLWRGKQELLEVFWTVLFFAQRLKKPPSVRTSHSPIASIIPVRPIVEFHTRGGAMRTNFKQQGRCNLVVNAGVSSCSEAERCAAKFRGLTMRTLALPRKASLQKAEAARALERHALS